MSQQVVVAGAGLIGLCSAWWLRQAGHDVTIVERRDGVGLETCFANGGMLTPSMSEPWNAPGIHRELLQSLFDPQASFLARWKTLPMYVGWGLRFLENSLPRRFERAIEANLALSLFSLQTLQSMRRDLDLNYQSQTNGSIKLFRSERALDESWQRAEQLHALGLQAKRLGCEEIAEEEPFLEHCDDQFIGAIRYLDDEVGNAHLFAQEIRQKLVQAGVQFQFETRVQALQIADGRVRAVQTNQGILQADSVVVALANESVPLLAAAGVELSVRPVKGYSLTLDMGMIAGGNQAKPRLAMIDDERHVSATPIGSSLRLAGTAELAGFDQRIDDQRIENLRRYLKEICPEMPKINSNQENPWCGLRPMSSDGRPYIGSTGIDGLFVNTGHGHLGWTQAAGSGRLLAAMMQDEIGSLDFPEHLLARLSCSSKR